MTSHVPVSILNLFFMFAFLHVFKICLYPLLNVLRSKGATSAITQVSCTDINLCFEAQSITCEARANQMMTKAKLI